MQLPLMSSTADNSQLFVFHFGLWIYLVAVVNFMKSFCTSYDENDVMIPTTTWDQ